MTMPDVPNGVRSKIAHWVALVLAACIFGEVAIGVISTQIPPQDWNLVNSAVSNLHAIALLLAGGLLGLAKPGGAT